MERRLQTALDDRLLRDVEEIEGYKVLGPCVLYHLLGRGGMGAVYKGRHLRLDVDVAVKCLSPELAERDEVFVTRFEREARAAARLNHPNVVRVYDVDHEADLRFIVMEFVDGESGAQRVQRKGALAVPEAVEIARGAAQGLAAAHRYGLVHRDVKPDNLLVSTAGEVKVADLGLVRPEGGDTGLTMSNVVMGTPQYMSPEQCQSARDVGPATDVYALGATLYFLLSGENAIGGTSLMEVLARIQRGEFPDVRERVPHVPDGLAELIAHATAPDPSDRPADAAEFAQLLEPFVNAQQAALAEDTISTLGGKVSLVSPPPPARTLTRIQDKLDSRAGDGDGFGDEEFDDDFEEARGRSASMWLGIAAAVAVLLAAGWYVMGALERRGSDQVGSDGTALAAMNDPADGGATTDDGDAVAAPESTLARPANAAAPDSRSAAWQATLADARETCDVSQLEQLAADVAPVAADGDPTAQDLLDEIEAFRTVEACIAALPLACGHKLSRLLEQSESGAGSECQQQRLDAELPAALARQSSLAEVQRVLAEAQKGGGLDAAEAFFAELASIDVTSAGDCAAAQLDQARTAWALSLDGVLASWSSFAEPLAQLPRVEALVGAAGFSVAQREPLEARVGGWLDRELKRYPTLEQAEAVLASVNAHLSSRESGPFDESISNALGSWSDSIEVTSTEPSTVRLVDRLLGQFESSEGRSALLAIAGEWFDHAARRVDAAQSWEHVVAIVDELQPPLQTLVSEELQDLVANLAVAVSGSSSRFADVGKGELKRLDRALEKRLEEVDEGPLRVALAGWHGVFELAREQMSRDQLHAAKIAFEDRRITDGYDLVIEAKRSASESTWFLAEVIRCEGRVHEMHESTHAEKKRSTAQGTAQALDSLLNDPGKNASIDAYYDGFSAREWGQYLREELTRLGRRPGSTDSSSGSSPLRSQAGQITNEDWGRGRRPMDPRKREDR